MGLWKRLKKRLKRKRKKSTKVNRKRLRRKNKLRRIKRSKSIFGRKSRPKKRKATIVSALSKRIRKVQNPKKKQRPFKRPKLRIKTRKKLTDQQKFDLLTLTFSTQSQQKEQAKYGKDSGVFLGTYSKDLENK